MDKLTILGSGSAVQFQNRASASYLIELGKKKLLLDAGFWLLERLEQLSIRADEIDYIFISHKHPDHFLGLVHFLFALKNPFYNRKNPIIIFGFKGLKEYFFKYKTILGSWIEPGIELVFQEEFEYSFENFSYKLFNTVHSEESVGVQIFINNKKITYTSDTEYFDNLKNFIKNSQIAIFDCASSEKNKIKGHMSIEDIIKVAANLSIEKVIISHFYPASIPTISIPENFIIAKDLLSVKIN